MRAGIALGANLGDRVLSLTTARGHIFALPGIAPPLLSSALYETDPVDCEEGAEKFLNAVIEIGYGGTSRKLLEELREIEKTLGRPPEHERNTSRTIDLDLLYHGSRAIDEADLQLPHPRLHLRGFVLHPLAEIRPDLVLPGRSTTILELTGELAPSPSVVRSARQW
ncbi:MAG: 2-amino-4-hydroxy-6-hydroxymethyldihydropteridine diphosphokinase [Chthoniobacterales bacterium]